MIIYTYTKEELEKLYNGRLITEDISNCIYLDRLGSAHLSQHDDQYLGKVLVVGYKNRRYYSENFGSIGFCLPIWATVEITGTIFDDL